MRRVSSGYRGRLHLIPTSERCEHVARHQSGIRGLVMNWHGSLEASHSEISYF